MPPDKGGKAAAPALVGAPQRAQPPPNPAQGPPGVPAIQGRFVFNILCNGLPACRGRGLALRLRMGVVRNGA